MRKALWQRLPHTRRSQFIAREDGRPAGTYPPVMSHAERRAVIEAPIRFRYVEPHTWAGVLIERDPEGRVSAFKRASGPAIEDESYLDAGE